MRPPFHDDDQLSVATVLEDFDPSKHSPVFFGNMMHKKINTDEPATNEFNPSVSHPACVGYAFVSRPPPATPPISPSPPDKRLCKYRQVYWSWTWFAVKDELYLVLYFEILQIKLGCKHSLLFYSRQQLIQLRIAVLICWLFRWALSANFVKLHFIV